MQMFENSDKWYSQYYKNCYLILNAKLFEPRLEIHVFCMNNINVLWYEWKYWWQLKLFPIVSTFYLKELSSSAKEKVVGTLQQLFVIEPAILLFW